MVRITKDSMYFEIRDAKGVVVQTVDAMATNMGIVSYMSYPVIIEDGVTVEDIFLLLGQNPECIDFAFDSSLGGHSFMMYLDEILAEEKVDKSITNLIKDVEIVWDVEELGEDRRIKENPRIWGRDNDDQAISIELFPLSSYKKLPLRLNEAYCLFENDVPVFEGTKTFTLYNLIHALLYEASYHGEPMNRTLAYEKLLKSYEEGEEMPIKVDEVERLKRELQLSVEREDYEKAAKIRDKLSKTKKKKKSKEHPPKDDI